MAFLRPEWYTWHTLFCPCKDSSRHARQSNVWCSFPPPPPPPFLLRPWLAGVMCGACVRAFSALLVLGSVVVIVAVPFHVCTWYAVARAPLRGRPTPPATLAQGSIQQNVKGAEKDKRPVIWCACIDFTTTRATIEVHYTYFLRFIALGT